MTHVMTKFVRDHRGSPSPKVGVWLGQCRGQIVPHEPRPQGWLVLLGVL